LHAGRRSPVADGRWPIADGRWSMVDGRWPMADSTRQRRADAEWWWADKIGAADPPTFMSAQRE